MSSRVAVIGAGPSGLAQLHAFENARGAGEDVPEVVCFEKQRDWGGLWNYTWRTGLDEYGEPVHGSMYRYLWSNGPKECLEFADYTFDEHFGKPIPSFPPREVLYDYVTGRAKKDKLRRKIRFNTAIRWIDYDQESREFSLSVEKIGSNVIRIEKFDYVIVATGHYSVPNTPSFQGFEKFPGRILHSHDFRDAREFSGQDLLLIGGSYSAEDLALQSKKYGASSVSISYRSQPMSFPWPDGVDEVPLLSRVEGNMAHFIDGTSRKIDAIVLCTGYQHAFDFVADDLRLRTGNVLCPAELYKGVFWLDNPKMMYLGMQDQYYTFTMFDLQAWYARDYVLGRIKLPTRHTMAADIEAWRTRMDSCLTPVDEIDLQADYLMDLSKEVDYPSYDIDLTRENFHRWEDDKDKSIIGYRDCSFRSACTGTVAPPRTTPWWEQLDDSMAAFLAEGT